MNQELFDSIFHSAADERTRRWRLILGKDAGEQGNSGGESYEIAEMYDEGEPGEDSEGEGQGPLDFGDGRGIDSSC